MTQVDFYVGAHAPYDVVFQLCQKALQRKWSVRILTSSAEETRKVDEHLWQRPHLGFLPHCCLGDSIQSETPVWIGEALTHEGPADFLINLNGDVPPFFAQFLRLAEIVGQDDEQKAAGRQRYRYYQQRGYPLQVHSLDKGARSA